MDVQGDGSMADCGHQVNQACQLSARRATSLSAGLALESSGSGRQSHQVATWNFDCSSFANASVKSVHVKHQT